MRTRKIITALLGAMMGLVPLSPALASGYGDYYGYGYQPPVVYPQQAPQSNQQVVNNFSCNGGGSYSTTVCQFNSTNVLSAVNGAPRHHHFFPYLYGYRYW